MKTPTEFISSIVVLPITLLLVSCGGAGSSSTSSGSTPTAATAAPAVIYTLTVPSKLAAIPAAGGTSFPTPVTTYGYGTVAFPNETFTDSYLYSVLAPAMTTGSIAIYPTTHLTDTNAATAWTAGWTGKGTNITIIDDFQSAAVDRSLTINATRTKTFTDKVLGSYIGSYSVDYKFSDSVSHGALVSNIAGGDFDGQSVSLSVQLAFGTAGTLLSCPTITKGTGFTTTCPNDFYRTQSYLYTKTTETITYNKVAGIAKETLITEDNVDLSSYKSAGTTLAFIQGHLANSSFSSVVNLSVGADIPTTGSTFDQVMASVAQTPLAKSINSVIVVAAGNGGAPCATADLSGCNVLAVALAFQNATKDTTIVAGALEGTGSSENIATYSTRAGILASRFLLAQGTTGYSGVDGTSFAAPRIAGAAAIVKQRYPSLTAKQIADVLLLSANKDINNSGIPSFTGVHPVYGHGKLDLARALSLAGAM